MSLTDNDKKRIGKNIQYLRKANHRSVDELADLLHVSKDKIQHIENGSYPKDNWDDIIKEMSSISGYTFNQIRFDDLSKIEKDSLYFGDKVKATEFFEVLETDNCLKELFSYMLPIVKDNQSNDSKYFIDATKQLEIAFSNNGTKVDLLNAISMFLDSYLKDGVAIGCINALSCLGYLFLFCLGEEVDENKIEQIKANNYMEMLSKLHSSVDKNDLSTNKKEFFSKYNNLINECIDVLNKYDEYKDYLIFYTSTRYQLGMFDISEVKMNEDEMHRFGESLFNNLFNLGNKYAVRLHNYLEEIE